METRSMETFERILLCNLNVNQMKVQKTVSIYYYREYKCLKKIIKYILN